MPFSKNSPRGQLIVILLSTLFIGLIMAHITATASQEERVRAACLVADTIEAKQIKVGGIVITSQGDCTGVWITDNKTQGMVSMYVTKNEGPVVGIHRNKTLTGGQPQGFDLALSARNGEPVVQYRKPDGSLGMVTIKELEKMSQVH